MMGWWKFKKKRELSDAQEKQAMRWALLLVGLQLKIAAKLSSWTAGWTVWAWRICLVLFSVLFGGYCIYLLVDAIYK